MDQKTILITGCSSGIGYAVAKGLKSRGYRVFATARRPEDVETLNAEGFESFQLDLADSASIQHAVHAVLDRTGGTLYALFNNGAYGQPGAVEDLSRDTLRAQFETNLFGTVELTNLLIPIMRKQREGRIIQNSSLLGLVAMPYRGAYIASKFALEGLTHTLRMELQGSGIQVSLIEPGPILSKFRDNSYKMYQRYIQPDQSVHKTTYLAMEKRLLTKGAAVPFTLPSEAVLPKVIHALESRSPKAQYYVTFPTYLFATLRRLLSAKGLDAVTRRFI